MFDSISIRGIRNLREVVRLPLAPSVSGSSVLTLSGANGSGKSAVAESLAALQRAALIDGLGHALEPERFAAWRRSFARRLSEIVADDSAYVVLSFRTGGVVSSIALDINLRSEQVWDLSIDDGEAFEVAQSWSSSDPRNLIVFVPSTKYFEQSDMMFTDIRIDGSAPLFPDRPIRDDPRTSLFMDPGDAIRHVYRRMIEDWYLERLVPSNLPRTTYNTVARILFSKLVPGVAIGNFSTSTKAGQIVAQAKRTGPRRRRNYDVRGLSSGEKYLYFAFNYISRFIGRTGILVVDEPDTHLHESTLAELLSVLHALTDTEAKGPTLLRDWARESGLTLQSGMNAALNKVCPLDRPLLGGALLLTHSKMLVRSNLAVGRNFLLQGNSVFELTHDSVEDGLRSAGLSQVDERVVFVEGDRDVRFLEHAMRGLRVDVRAERGSTGVMAAFEGFARVDPNRRMPGFAFVIDRDRTNDMKYRRLKERFQEAWARHVIVLDRLELENYLLEARPIIAAVNSFLDDDGRRRHKHLLTEGAIDGLLRRYADATRSQMLQSYLDERVEFAVHRVGQAARSGVLDVQSPLSFLAFAATVLFGDDARASLSSDVTLAYSDAQMRYGDQNWAVNWRSLCKGKGVFAAAVNDLQRTTELGPALAERIRKFAIADPDIALAGVLTRLLDALHVPAADRRRLRLGPQGTPTQRSGGIARRRPLLREQT